MKFKKFSHFHQYTSAFLIFLLFITQTVQVSFFDVSEAATTDYHDIVSLVVDQDTYSALSGPIKRYAEDIQGYLGSTRVSLYIVPKNTAPEVIAAQNEKLYYEGDDKTGVSSLVGTILIGNISIPVVHKDGVSFPSLYPYIDFDDKRFVFDQKSRRYEYNSTAPASSDVDIWHGVINPAVGRTWSQEADIKKIGQFLDKTHDFYTKSGKFTPSTIPPRVFYYDGYTESNAANLKSIFQYGLFIKNSENFAYKRFTKYLLSDVMSAVKQYEDSAKGPEDAYISSLGINPGSDTLDSASVAKLPDIQTPRLIAGFVKKFYEIINSKTLGDEQLFVHNAGRYNSGTSVGVDQGAVQVTVMDEIAQRTLKSANDALEESIDRTITEGNYAKKLLIFDTIQTSSGSPITGNLNDDVVQGTGGVYDGYFFGSKSENIKNPSECTIVRGSSEGVSEFGKSVLAEANAAFDVKLTESQAALMKNDTEELTRLHTSASFACFDTNTNKAKIKSYWGGNSLLRIAGADSGAVDTMFGTGQINTDIKGFSLPIFSLGGMKETTRLHAPTIQDCMTDVYQYTLRRPYVYKSTITTGNDQSNTVECNSGWPDEWTLPGACSKDIGTRKPRYSCLTEHKSLDDTYSVDIKKNLKDYDTRSCFFGSLFLDKKSVKDANRSCITMDSGGEGAAQIDTTDYQNIYYHTIPSLLKHVSPTKEEIDAAEDNGATPSTAVDIVRSLEFLTPKGNIAHLTYPNLFTAPANDIASFRKWIKNQGDAEWKAIIDKENNTTVSPEDAQVNALIGAGSLPSAPLDWNSLISDAVLTQVLQAKNWLHPDVSKKYKNYIETALSYSHSYGGIDASKDPVQYPHASAGYEIAYLGLTPFIPNSESDGTDSPEMQDYQFQLQTIEGLNLSEIDANNPDNPYKSSDECGPPDGVDIFKWPGAIACWLKTLLPPKIIAGSCSPNTIGISTTPTTSVSPSNAISQDDTKLTEYYNSAKLGFVLPRTVMGRSDSLEMAFDLIKDGSHVNIATQASTKLEILSVESDGKVIPPENYEFYLRSAPSESPYADGGSRFILSSKDHLLTARMRATLSVRLPGGSSYTTVSDIVTIRVTDEYIDVVPTLDDTPVSIVDGTAHSPLVLTLAPKNSRKENIAPAYPYTLDVYDDISGNRMASGIFINTANYTLPVDYTKKIGSYRLALRDASGRYGEATISVRSGPLSKIEFFPLSNAFVKGAASAGAIRLTDSLGNLILPELHTLSVKITGGYLIDNLENHVTEMKIDTTNAEVPLSYGSDTAGKIEITITIDDKTTLKKQISVIESAKIQLERSGVPVVGGDDVTFRVKVVDDAGKVIDGFVSSLTLSLPEGVGTFKKDIFPIQNGQTDEFTFTPGRLAGDHHLSLVVPGMGAIPDISFIVNPGTPMYMKASVGTDVVDFILNDRYGNSTLSSLPGTLQKNAELPTAVNFINGKYSIPRNSGYYTLRMPSLSDNKIRYGEGSGSYVVSGIPYVSIYVPPTLQKFQFLSDYNARYTVLAGDAHLSESEDILYNVIPGASQSLAASTLLASPYQKDVYFSLFPGGGYTLGSAGDTAIKTTLRIEKNIPVLDVNDEVSRTRIARVGYLMKDIPASICHEKNESTHNCEESFARGQIRLALYDGSDFQVEQNDTSIRIAQGNNPLIQYTKNIGFTLGRGMSLEPDDSLSQAYLTANILINGTKIGRLILSLDSKKSVHFSQDVTSSSDIQDLLLLPSPQYSHEEAYNDIFDKNIAGYSLYKQTPSPILDERIIGPNHIDSLGSISETPGVGWQGNNRMLLSYAAGDTVGEASKWYNTYTFVNLGDPVTHVEQGAPGTQLDGIDRTIGTEIASSVHGNISSYMHRDMNHDGYEDIVVVYSDGFLELILNTGGKFRKRQKIAYLPDLTNRGISLGDFTGDGYADIIGLNSSGSFVYVDNKERKLSRAEITIQSDSSLSIPVPSGISQYKIFDMDKDGRDDIVYLNENGEMGILYGTAISGVFAKKILDSHLGVSLSEDPDTFGGAIRANVVSDLPSLNTASTGTGVDDTMLKKEVYYQRMSQTTAGNTPQEITITGAANIDSVFNQNLLESNNTSSSHIDTYIKSEYAPAVGIAVSKVYHNISNSIIHAGDHIEVDISLKNTSTKTITNLEYLDTISNIFDASDTKKYRLEMDGQVQEKTFTLLQADDYDAYFTLRDIPAGSTLHLIYEVTALPVAYGEMIVDNLEKGESGDDAYGDVGFMTSNTCGTDMILWRSTEAHTYERGTRSFTQAELPPSLANKLIDKDKNNVPDSVENMTLEDRQNALKEMGNGTALTTKPLLSANVNTSSQLLSLDFSPQAVADISNIAENLANGFACGFGGGSCMSFPVNWAPLAPGSSPVVFGIPIMPNLMTPIAGVPVFAAPTICPGAPPFIGTWPGCPFGAGGGLPVMQPPGFSQVRIFVTPTLTLGIGTAICIGPNIGGINPLYPYVKLGNCIVMAKPMNVCKGDGSDIDVAGLSGLGTTQSTWNGASCTLKTQTLTQAEDKSLTQDIIGYLKSPDTKRLNALYSSLSNRGARSLTAGPIVKIGAGGTSGTELGIDIDLKKPFNIGNIVNVKNKRIAGFPDFIMDWVSRQTDEITNKLFTPPNLIIVQPKNIGQNAAINGDWDGFLDKFSEASFNKGINDLKQKWDATGSKPAITSPSTTSRPTGYTSIDGVKTALSDAKTGLDNTLAPARSGANQIRAAYQFIGQLPFLRIEPTAVAINIPWILPNELDRYARVLEGYKREIDATKKSWCNGDANAKCLDSHAALQLGWLQSSIEQNLRRIEEYKRFPEKIQKYVTWKQKYISQLLCNVNSLEYMIGGWYRDNGVRFRKWAEFYVLVKAIAQSWQPLIDIFKVREEQCAVCRNQRYNLQYWKMKLLSMLIPSLPIITFPKWPNLVLDLSDIRLAIAVKVPDFRFNINPIRLPNLPGLGLPRLPSASLSLPALDILPPVPLLPDLPNLPSFPKIVLPNLPPPPKLPKLFGAVSVVLNILKLYSKIVCFMNNTNFAPEDYAGTLIAMKTERQGTLPMDFLNIQFPQMSLAFLKEIRVSTHVNFEMRSDFITEYARASVKPINEFGTDLTKSIPSQLGDDIRVTTPPNVNLKIDSYIPSKDMLVHSGITQSVASLTEELERNKDAYLSVDDFTSYLKSEMIRAGQDPSVLTRSIKRAQIEADSTTKELEKSSKEGFSLIYKYLDAQQADTKEVEKMIDRLRDNSSLLSLDEGIPRAHFVSRDTSYSDVALEKYNTWTEMRNTRIAQVDDNATSSILTSTQGKMRRLLAANDASTSTVSNSISTTSSSNITSGYAPRFEGIYIKTPSGIQTRLFDYTSLVGSDDSAEMIDIDKDGDMDYIFILGGTLYIKYNHTREPSKTIDTSLEIHDIDTTLTPYTPNFFDEVVASPGQIEVSFSPADRKDTNFRLEFFDRYMQWDIVKMNQKENPDTPKTIVDLTTSSDVSTLSNGTEVLPVTRTLDSVDNTDGFVLEGMSSTVLTSGRNFGLTAGRALYTGPSSATIEYDNGSGGVDRLDIRKYQRYVFPKTISGSVRSGKVYILSQLSTQRTPYSDDLIGMPILPGAHILNTKGGFTIYDTEQKTFSRIGEGAEYRYISLGNPSTNYSVTFPYTNGYYSARLMTNQKGIYQDIPVHAGVTLLSPQAFLDKSAPVIDIPEKIRVPVYQQTSFDLKNFITDRSAYTVSIDPDITVDSDKNGVFDDDFVQSGTGVIIIGSSIAFGPFSNLGIVTMKMRVTDIFGNTSILPIQIEVYPPTPKIEIVTSSGMLQGNIDTPVTQEPIHLFRIRGGSPLEMLFPRKIPTIDGGIFSTGGLFGSGEVQLSYSGGKSILTDTTGILQSNTDLKMSVSPANSVNPMLFVFSDAQGRDLFRQTLSLPVDTEFVISPTIPTKNPALIFTPVAGFRIEKANPLDPSIPGGVYIIDEASHRAVAVVARDGQIYKLDPSVTLSAISKNNYINISIKKGDVLVTTIEYRVNFFYTGK